MAGIENMANSFLDKAAGGVGAAASAANGVAGLIDGIFGFSAKRQYKNQKKLMEQQQNYWKEQQEILAGQQLDQWNRENEYNDPTNYYKRLLQGTDANGLSKAAVLGDQPGGTVGQSGHQQVPASGSGVGLGSSTLQPIGSASSLSNLKQRSEIANIDALTNMYNTQAGVAGSQQRLNEANIAVADANARLINEQALSEPVRRALTSQQEIYQKFQNSAFDARNEAEIRKLVSDAYDAFQRGSKTGKEANWVDKQAESSLKATYAMIALNGAQAIAQQKLADLYGAQYVSQLNDNEQWSRTIDSIVKRIETEARFAGVPFMSQAVSSIGHITVPGYGALGVSSVSSGHDLLEALTSQLFESGKPPRSSFKRPLKK